MTNADANNMTNKKIQQLLGAIGNAPAQPQNIDSQPYDFSVPHYFTEPQNNLLKAFADKIAAGLKIRFSTFFNSEINVTVTETVQHYAGVFFENSQQELFNLEFSDNQKNTHAMVVAPYPSVESWLSMLLGDDTEKKEDEKAELSNLEASLLIDIMSLFVKTFTKLAEGYNFNIAPAVLSSLEPLDINQGTELLQITFDIIKTEGESKTAASLVIPCSVFDSVVGKASLTSEMSPEIARKGIEKGLSEVDLPVTIQLDSIKMTLDQVMSLQKNDCIILDKNIDQGAEVLIQSKPLFVGKLAKHGQKKAIVVTGTYKDPN